MTESIDQGLSSKPGRNPQDADQGFDETRSLEEAFDDRGSIERILDGAHEKATGKSGRVTAFTAGAAYLLEEAVTQMPEASEGIYDVVNQAGQVASQYPEASTGALVVAGALTAYNAADEAGLVDATGNGMEYVKDALTEVDEGYDEITEGMVDEGLEPFGIPVDSETGPEEIEAYSGKEEYDPTR
ncbi:MAG: hypothetical protein ABEK04_05875 [Candidatus Nanohalobium sp.]